MPGGDFNRADPVGVVGVAVFGFALVFVRNFEFEGQLPEAQLDLGRRFIGSQAGLFEVAVVETELLVGIHLIGVEGFGIPIGVVFAAVIEQVKKPVTAFFSMRYDRENEQSAKGQTETKNCGQLHDGRDTATETQFQLL